jgi:large subunit ribosomal protein L6
MSRIGKLPVVVSPGVNVTIQSATIHLKGPKGELSCPVVAGVDIERKGNELSVVRKQEDAQSRSNHGLMRALLNSMMVGVTKGFERKLEIQGVGFKSELKGKALLLSLGYSHQIEFPFPPGITIDVPAEGKGTKLVIKGCSKELVGETAARLKRLRSPDSYKGKGIRDEGEVIHLKQGKTAKK